MDVQGGLRITEFERVQRAFLRIRQGGGFASLSQCCVSCAWEEVAKAGATSRSTVALVERESMQASFPNGPTDRLSAPLDIHHRGDARLICEALEAEGLRVEWDGEEDEEILVLPATLH